MNLEKLETAVSKKLEQWNVEDLNIILNNEEFRNILLDNENIIYVIEHCPEILKDILIPISINKLINNSTSFACELLQNYLSKKIDKKTFLQKCDEQIKNGNTYDKTSIFHILLVFFKEEVEKYKNDIKENVLSLKNKVIEMGKNNKFILSYYEVLSAIIDMIFSIRHYYYQIFNIDILDDDKQFTEILHDIDSISDFINEVFANSMKEKN